MGRPRFTAGLQDEVALYEIAEAIGVTGAVAETTTLLISGLRARLTRVRSSRSDEEKGVGEVPTQRRDCTIEDTDVLTDHNADYRLLEGSTWYEVLDFIRQRDKSGTYHHVFLRLRLIK